MNDATPGAAKATKNAYRPGVGIILMNADGHVWVGRRFGITSEAWQMPQGGIDPGETPEATALRELTEETGVTPDLAEIIAVSAGWHQYEVPPELTKTIWAGRYRGQRQKWFVMRFHGRDSDIEISTKEPEFLEWRWLPPADLARCIIDFKRPLYEALVDEFSAFLKYPRRSGL